MAKFLYHDHLVEEDYIDMDISSCPSPSTFLCCTTSPPHSKDFEFHKSSHPQQREAITSPADELFYKGKLLPLHLPPRLEMVDTLLQSSNTNTYEAATTTNNTAETTPFESCNISPANSCCVSGELKPQEYYYECSSRLTQPPQLKKSWTRRLKSIKQSPLASKLKASRDYFKSLFSKSECSESCSMPRDKECSNSYLKEGKRNPFAQVLKGGAKFSYTCRYIDEELKEEEYCYRRSFSGIIKWYSNSTVKSSSCSPYCTSFSCANSSSLHNPQTLRRSSSIDSEIESSIQGAIAYCKKSQQTVFARKSVSDVEFCSISRVAAIC